LPSEDERIKRYLAALTVAVLFAAQALARTTSSGNPDNQGTSAPNAWSFSIAAAGYVVPHAEFFVSPTLTADRDWLHIEARDNY
jgi:hypothetical protein